MSLTRGNGAIDGVLPDLAALEATRPALNTRLELLGGQRYRVDSVDAGQGIELDNNLFANPVFSQSNIRFSKLDNPLCHLFKTNNLSALSAPLNTNADITWTRTTEATLTDRYGDEQIAAINEPREEKEGFLIEGASTNLFLNSPVGVTQSVSITNGSVYTVSFNEGAGSITLTGGGTGVVTSSTDITFTATSTSVTLTVSGQADKVNLENLPFSTSHIITAGAAATRTEDKISINGFNNQPDFEMSIFLNVDVKAAPSQNANILTNGSDFTVFYNVNNSKLNTNIGDASTTEALPQGVPFNYVYTASLNDTNLYIDGLNVNQGSTYTTKPTIETSLFIGNRQAGSRVMYGHLKDLRFYDFTLSQDEVTYLAGQ